MKISRKLEQWRSAGLIDDEAAARIEAFERERSRPVALYAVGGIGSVAIVLGIVAIIASNWADIRPETKLAVDGGVAVALAIAILRQQPGWLREVLVIVNYGLVLGSMALIGQIYNLDAGTWRALLAWSIATFPMMLIAQGRFAASIWVVGLVTTHLLCLVPLFEWVEAAGLGQRRQLEVAFVVVSLSPYAYLLFSRTPWLRRERSSFAGVFRAAGWLGIAVLVMGAASLFYERVPERETLLAGPLVVLAASIGLAAWLGRLEAELSSRARLGLRVLLVGGAANGLLAVALERADWPLLGAVLQVFWLGWMAWTALQAGHEGLFRLGVAAVCLRLLGIYIEVFGSLLETGLGLIVGGLLTLGLAWFWLRKSKGLAQALVDPAARRPVPQEQP